MVGSGQPRSICPVHPCTLERGVDEEGKNKALYRAEAKVGVPLT